MNKEQMAFLQQLGARIPPLFEAIARGNVKSEFIIGVRNINGRQVRLKLSAEVVDPGSNPLATHGQMMRRYADTVDHSAVENSAHDEEPIVDEQHAETPGVPSTSDNQPPPVGPASRRRARRR